ncbi:alpha/beta hydrolase [Pseudomonas aeruginosa]|uniref:alpha/beta hydrolase n=1 Tax=Pseudomonas aeruginosa TaxID=287 RepID=UPI001CC4DE09|nr:alpha/beta hydrolase [Pseudomonas aeruginosa]
MSKSHVLLIHGTWCNGGNWGLFAKELEQRGHTVHAPSLRYHGAPGQIDIWDSAQKVSKMGLLDYVEDLARLVDQMDSPPIVIGHSAGALLAQLLAARRATKGVVLLGPAPTAGMFSMYPSMCALWGRYTLQWLLRKPMYPVAWKPWAKLICNAQPLEIQQSYYATLCAESGYAYWQMALWFLDWRERAAWVDFKAIRSPVLVITGSEDKCTHPRIGRVTAKKYGERGTYVELLGSDHMMTVGRYLPQTLSAIDRWAEINHLSPPRPKGPSNDAKRYSLEPHAQGS